MLVYGERIDGSAAPAAVHEGFEWMRRAAAGGSEVAHRMLARVERRTPRRAAADATQN
jgi:hypothetical protein